MTEQIAAVQKMQNHIEAHPAEYIRRMRLAKSALRMKTEHTRIIDAAFDLGFAGVDGYTRAFHKEFGINPGEYSKSPVPIQLHGLSFGSKDAILKGKWKQHPVKRRCKICEMVLRLAAPCWWTI